MIINVETVCPPPFRCSFAADAEVGGHNKRPWTKEACLAKVDKKTTVGEIAAMMGVLGCCGDYDSDIAYVDKCLAFMPPSFKAKVRAKMVKFAKGSKKNSKSSESTMLEESDSIMSEESDFESERAALDGVRIDRTAPAKTLAARLKAALNRTA